MSTNSHTVERGVRDAKLLRAMIEGMAAAQGGRVMPWTGTSAWEDLFLARAEPGDYMVPDSWCTVPYARRVIETRCPDCLVPVKTHVPWTDTGMVLREGTQACVECAKVRDAEYQREQAAENERRHQEALRYRRENPPKSLEQQASEADEKFGPGVWALVAETGSKSPATSGNRMEKVSAFLRAHNVTADRCVVQYHANVWRWLNAKCRSNEPPAAYIGATHTHGNDYSGWVIQIAEEA